MLALLVGACAEVELAAYTAKRIVTPSEAPQGVYKVGEPYQVDSVWYTPAEGPDTETPKSSVHSVQWRRTFDFFPTVKRVGVKLFAKSAAIGAFIGALPGAGAAMAAFLAYAEAKRSSPHPEKFGTGIPEGIVAPETANNAMTGGAFVPMLAFGIPGDAVTAVIGFRYTF